ncbi:MAG: hypothetical protein AB7H97_18290, partial [Pseudobdellovibrionaceae bacterium]
SKNTLIDFNQRGGLFCLVSQAKCPATNFENDVSTGTLHGERARGTAHRKICCPQAKFVIFYIYLFFFVDVSTLERCRMGV